MVQRGGAARSPRPPFLQGPRQRRWLATESTTRMPGAFVRPWVRFPAMAKRASKKRVSQQGVRIPDEVRAQVWVLREEGRSYRQISAQLGINPTSVSRILSADPERLGALARAQADDRRRAWQAMEDRSVSFAVQILDEAQSVLFTKGGKRKSRALSELQRDFLKHAEPWLRTARLAADTGAKQSQRLGEAAVAGLTASTDAEAAAGEMNDEQIIDAAIELGVVEMLPAELRERADARKANGS